MLNKPELPNSLLLNIHKIILTSCSVNISETFIPSKGIGMPLILMQFPFSV